MAVEGTPANTADQSKKATTQPPRGGKPPASGAPVWLVPAYVGGLVLLYLGQHVVITIDALSLILTVVGIGLVVVTTALRFVPKFRGTGERAAIENWLGWLSVIGLLGVLVYMASTARGLDLFGVTDLELKSRERVQSLLLIAWVVLVGVGTLPLLFAEAALYPMRSSAQLESRRVRAAAVSGLSLALAVSYCSLFVYAAGQTKAQADYSYFKTSEPGTSTRKLLEAFTEPVKITAFFPDVSDVRAEVAGYLTELTKGVPNVELAIVDRYLEPKLAKDLKVFSDGSIVFAKGDTTKTLSVGSDMQSARGKLKTLDRDVQEQLYKLLRSRRVAYMTVGHGEMNEGSEADKARGRTVEIVQEILRSQNYQIRPLGLTQGLGREVPGDAEIVFVLGPTQAFAPEELQALTRYSEKGGRLFIALDSDTVTNELAAPTAQAEAAAVQPAAVQGAAGGSRTPTPPDEGLEALAKLAGLDYSPTLLANDTQYVRRRANNSDRALLVSNRFSSHASVSTLSRNASRAALIFARTGSLSALPNTDYKVDMALRAMTGTFADVNQNYEFDKDEKKETYNLVAAVTRPVAPTAQAAEKKDEKGDAKSEPTEMRAFVLADADSVSDLLMSNFGPNRMLLMDAVRWLGGEDSFAGEVNDEEDVRIEHSKQKDLVWFYSTIVGMPVLVLGAGLTLARRARRTSRAVSS